MYKHPIDLGPKRAIQMTTENCPFYCYSVVYHPLPNFSGAYFQIIVVWAQPKGPQWPGRPGLLSGSCKCVCMKAALSLAMTVLPWMDASHLRVTQCLTSTHHSSFSFIAQHRGAYQRHGLWDPPLSPREPGENCDSRSTVWEGMDDPFIGLTCREASEVKFLHSCFEHDYIFLATQDS